MVGRLPQPASDFSAAAIAGTAYVVGGFTGARWLDTILAWKPGYPAARRARLPVPLRYAAVTAAGGKLVIAGGSTPSGTASRTVLSFDPAGGRVRAIGRLPAPTTHAAAATLNGIAYVIGGRGSVVGSATARISAIDPSTGRVRSAGALAAPLSDLAAVSVRGGILLAGGRGPGRHVVRDRRARPGRTKHRHGLAAPKSLSATNVYAADAAGALSPAARRARPLIYVPNSQSDSVDEIDPRTYKVVRHFSVGALPQHVTPSYDLKTLYVAQRPRQQPDPDRPAQRSAPAGRSPWTTRTTCTSRPTGATRSSSPSASRASTSASRTPSGCTTRCTFPAAASTTWTSPPTAAT